MCGSEADLQSSANRLAVADDHAALFGVLSPEVCALLPAASVDLSFRCAAS